MCVHVHNVLISTYQGKTTLNVCVKPHTGQLVMCSPVGHVFLTGLPTKDSKLIWHSSFTVGHSLVSEPQLERTD